MKQFPITIVDNFYEDPDLVRDFALSLEYHSAAEKYRTTGYDGMWPGVRTKLISDIDQLFYNTFTRKLFGLFFDFDTTNIQFDIETKFQKINSFSNDRNHIKNLGWVHCDPAIFTAVVYLNPDDHLYSGTSIYKLKDGNEANETLKNFSLRHLGEKYNEKEYEIEKKNHNGKFVETVKIENVYNRLVLFERGVYHGVPTYYSESNNPRLTQISFVYNLNSSIQFPIERSKISSW
jgi:hypothetical protein